MASDQCPVPVFLALGYNGPQRHPPILALDLSNDLLDDRRGCARWLKRLRCRRIAAVGRHTRQQVLSVDESTARLSETLWRFLFAKAEDVHAQFAYPSGQASKIAVGRYEAEAVEAPAVQQIHRIDHEGDVGGVLAGGVGELLLWDDSVPRQASVQAFERALAKSP